MTRRQLAAGWVLTVVAFGAIFVWGLRSWRTLDANGREAAATRARLTATLKAKHDEVQRELRSQGLFRDVQWSMERTDPAAFLTGLAEQARGTRLKILAVGPLERKETQQFVKSSQTVQVIAPFADFKEVVARIERDRGLMEDLLIEVPRETPRPGSADAREVQARFTLTSTEVTGDARRSLQRALAVNRSLGAPLLAEAPSALPRPTTTTNSAARDPFAFLTPGVARAPRRPPKEAISTTKKAAASAPAGLAPGRGARPNDPRLTAAVPLAVKGIVSLPEGYLAIINQDILKVGDLVESHRVEQITETTVVLSQPDGGTLLLALPAVSAPAGGRE